MSLPSSDLLTIQKIVDLMKDGQKKVTEKYGKSIRISHAKAHAVLRGKLVVRDNLEGVLAQGLFAKLGEYEVLVRMASAPGELLDDSKVNATRGMAVKVFGVDGPKLPGHTSDTQDFVFAPGKVLSHRRLRPFTRHSSPTQRSLLAFPIQRRELFQMCRARRTRS